MWNGKGSSQSLLSPSLKGQRSQKPRAGQSDPLDEPQRLGKGPSTKPDANKNVASSVRSEKQITG